MEPKFKQGDLVRHRASLQFGVVVSSHTQCQTHLGFDVLTARHLSGEDCNYEFDGTYLLDLDYGDTCDADEFVLERVLQRRPTSQE